MSPKSLGFPLNLDYIHEKLYLALTSIAELDDTILVRLASAYFPHLDSLHTDRSLLDLPDSQASRLLSLLEKLESSYDPSIGDPHVGGFSFGADEASRIINGLFDVYDDVCRRLEPFD